MAKVIGPLHSIKARGKMGDSVFTRWRNLNVVRSYSATAGAPDTPEFIAWGAACLEWGSLTSAQRQAWREYAMRQKDRGDPWKPAKRSGYITYVYHAYYANLCGESYPSDPPITVAPGFAQGVALEENVSGNYELGWDSGQDGDYMMVKWLLNQDPAIRIYDDRLLYVGMVAMATGAKEGPAVIAGKINRASLTVIRDSGQAGKPNFISMES